MACLTPGKVRPSQTKVLVMDLPQHWQPWLESAPQPAALLRELESQLLKGLQGVKACSLQVLPEL